jgi:hypothetical protein
VSTGSVRVGMKKTKIFLFFSKKIKKNLVRVWNFEPLKNAALFGAAFFSRDFFFKKGAAFD